MTPAAVLPPGLAAELIDYLTQRQADTLSSVRKATRAAEERADAAIQRHAHMVDRLDRVEARLEHLADRASELRGLVQTLRAPVKHPTRDPIATAAVLASPATEHRNGHVAGAAVREDFKPGKVLLRVENLSKEIGGADILQDINFEIYENEILGLIGPNGAGKTTLMECLASLRPRTSGVFYDGDVAPADWNPRSLMFYLPNGVAPYAELYTIEVLTLFGKLFEIQPSRWERIIVEELSLVPVLQKKVSVLSKGNLQRLLIALALMSPQPFLALDEPFDGLDLHQTHAMMDILRGLRAQKRTLMLCIHQLNDAERICDRLLLLSGGRMLGIGTLDQLRAQANLSEGNLESIFLSLTGGRITSLPSPAAMR
jgi:ABC-2 type transport system ATP-binding protein